MANNSISYKIRGYGNNSYDRVIDSTGAASLISAGAFHVVKHSKQDNYVYGYGENYSGKTDAQNVSGNVPTKLSAGYNHSLALLSDTRVTGWGLDVSGCVSSLSGFSGVRDIAAGHDYSIFILNSGIVSGCGDNFSGLYTYSFQNSGFASVAAGYNHSLALKSGGQVSGVGDNYYNQLSGINGKTGISVWAGPYNSFIVYNDYTLGESGKVYGIGLDIYGQSTSGNHLTGVVKIAAGIDHTVALFSNGTVTGWGSNECGQIDFQNISGVVDISAGNDFSVILAGIGNATKAGERIKFYLNVSGTGEKIPINKMSIKTSLPKIVDLNNGSFYYDKSNFLCEYPNGYDLHKGIFAVTVSGQSLSGYPDDLEILIFKNNNVESQQLVGNDNWTSLPQGTKDYLINNDYINSLYYSGNDPAQVVKHLMSDSGVEYRVAVKSNNNYVNEYLDVEPSKFIYNFYNSEMESSPYDKITAPQDAYITYNVTSGANSKNVFSYALEVADFIKYNGRVLTNAPVSVYEYQPVIAQYPSATGGDWDYTETYVRICLAAGMCDDPEGKDKEINICWTGRDITGQAYLNFVAETINKYQTDIYNNDFQSESNLYFSQSGVDVLFNSWTGVIVFGDFVSGDKISFTPYNFEYNKIYNDYYKSNPPYEQLTGFSLTYQEDFNSPDSLLSSLNNYLKDDNLVSPTKKIWYPYNCPLGFGETGIFIPIISGTGLATASYIDPYEYYGSGLDTGIYSKLSGRLIKIQSHHFNSGGYNISVNLSNNRADIEATYKDSVEYLLPRTIQLLGSDDGISWDIVDYRTGIRWEDLTPISGTVNLNDLDEVGSTVFNDIILNGDITSGTSEVEFPSGDFQDLFTINQTKYKKSKSAYCPPITSNNVITAVWPTGWPEIYYISGGNPCKTGDGSGQKCGCSDPNALNYDAQRVCDCDDCCKYKQDDNNNPSENPNLANFVYYRTGWNVNPEWLGLEPNRLDEINYNYYKLYFSGFSNETGIRNGIIPVNSLYIKSIDFFSSVADFKPSLTGESVCVIGSEYSVDVMGHVPVRITGNLTGEVSSWNSGYRDFKNVLIEAPISGLSSGDLIQFNNESGRLISSNGTGTYSGVVIKDMYVESGINGWFYDNIDNRLYFHHPLSGNITGSGYLTGSLIEVNQDYINQQLMLGGIFAGLFPVNVTTGTLITGKMMLDVLRQDLTGRVLFPSVVSGYANSGFLQISSGVTVDASELIGFEADYINGGVTGYKNASAYLNYNTPDLFDYIIINGKTISYNSDDVNFPSPDFYSSSGNIIDIINSNVIEFGVSGLVDGGKIKVVSLTSGQNGNLINVSAGRGDNTGLYYPTFESTTLTGGMDMYRKITPTGTYTGILNAIYYSTGFYYTDSASGNITGMINSYQGQRDFTGIWNLVTGNFYTGYENFQQNNWISNFKYTNTVGGTGYCRTPSIFDLSILYTDLFSTQTNSDVVKITISGINTNSGLTYFITGINN